MAENKNTFNFYGIKHTGFKTNGNLINVEGIPLNQIDDLLANIDCEQVASWLASIDYIELKHIIYYLSRKVKLVQILDDITRR